MKIVIIGPAYPFRGGIASYNERLAKAYQDLGHEVSIHTFTTQYPNFLFPGKTQFSESDAPVGIEIHRSFSSVNPFTWLSLGLKLKRQRPDLIIFRYWLPFMGPSLGTIARLSKSNGHTKIVTLLDNVIPHEKRPGDHLFTKYFVGSSDGFMAMAQSVKNDLRTFDQNKPIGLSPHPLFDNFGTLVDRRGAAKHLGLDAEFKYLLFFGFIRKYKGLDLILRALDKELMEQNKMKLIIAGEFYDAEDTYQAIIEEQGIQDYIVPAHSFIKDDEVKYYFSLADLVVQPYKTATQSGVTQIAYQFDKPMLVTNVGGLPELVPDGKVGKVCEVNVEAIKKGLIDLLAMEDWSGLIAGVKDEKQRFAWETMCEKILEVKSQIPS